MTIAYNISPLRISEIHKRVSLLLAELEKESASKVHLQHKWNADNTVMEFSGEISGFNVKGTITLSPVLIVLEGDLPFLARMFKGKIESYIRKELFALFG